MSSTVYVDNKAKDILILLEGLDNTTLTPEAKYPINFIQSGKRLALSLHYNGSNSFSYFLMLQRSIQSKGLRNKRLCTVFR